MRSRRYGVLLHLAVLLALPQFALADAYSCDGQVIAIGVNNGAGRLWVSYGAFGWQTICQIDAAVNGVQANTCKAWMALLATAQAQQKTIRIYYDSATPGNPTSCAGLQNWGEHIPYFIHDL